MGWSFVEVVVVLVEVGEEQSGRHFGWIWGRGFVYVLWGSNRRLVVGMCGSDFVVVSHFLSDFSTFFVVCICLINWRILLFVITFSLNLIYWFFKI